MVEFKLFLKNSHVQTHDKFTVSVNDVTMGCYDLSIEELTFMCDTVPGWNCLKIAFNRSELNTFVQVDEIFIEKSAMKYLLNDFGQVIPNYDLDPGLEKWFIETQGIAPDCFPKRKMLDMPGVYVFRFLTPLKDFFESFYQIPNDYKQHYNQPLDRYLKLENLIRN